MLRLLCTLFPVVVSALRSRRNLVLDHSDLVHGASRRGKEGEAGGAERREGKE